MKMLGVIAAVLVLGLIGVAAIAGGQTASETAAVNTHGAAIGDIPESLFSVYVAAAGSCPSSVGVLAAIGFFESRHGGGHVDPSTGDVSPQILGVALDGTGGVARVRDPASPDGWAHAQGPMQFLPSTWGRWGRLAPGRSSGAVPSPHNAWDAIWTAAYLCGSDGRITDLRAVILSYSNDSSYVGKVLSKAAEYESTAQTRVVSADGLTCPVAGAIRHSVDWHAARSGGRQHQGNDVFAPAGTVLVAIESGVIDKSSDVDSGLGGITIWVRGDSGTRWYYAPNRQNHVSRGTRVVAGQPIALVGNTGNARTTASHVHFEMHPRGGGAADPYPVIEQLCRRAT
jgi:hypothetical protein